MTKTIINFSILFLLSGVSYSCMSVKAPDKCDLLKKIILSEEFEKLFKVCATVNDTLIVYDATKSFLECKSFNYPRECYKPIAIKKIDFEIDGQALMKASRDGIERFVLDEYKLENNRAYFKFVNLINFHTFTLKCKPNGENINKSSEGALSF